MSTSGTGFELDPGVESFWSRRGVTPGRFLHVGRGIRGQRRCATLWVGFHNSASLVDSTHEGCRSTIELRFTAMPDRRKGEEPAHTLIRDHGTQSTTLRKTGKVAKVSLVSLV